MPKWPEQTSNYGIRYVQVFGNGIPNDNGNHDNCDSNFINDG